MAFKSGFVNILGNPNVGKSTLMNALVGERLSIITSKAQTTRHRILGIINEEDYQIVFSDTPGILKPSYKLHKSMLGFIETAIEDADLILYVTDVREKADKNPEYIEKIKKSNIPVFVIINKIDLSDQESLAKLVENWSETLPKAKIYPISALEKFNVSPLLDKIKEALPENPPYFDKDALTDRNVRFFVSEIIREKILNNYQKEVPYSVEVEVESFKQYKGVRHIDAVINVARDSQKGIIIGHQGKKLKKTGSQARIDIEKFLDEKVFLNLFVKVNPDWRDNERRLKEFGY